MTEPNLKPGWRIYRFDQLAYEVKDRIERPIESGLERFVGLEHLDPGSLKIWRWGSTADVEKQKLLFRKGDIIFGRRNAYLRRVAVADFDGVCSAHAMVLRAYENVVLPEFLPFFMQTDTFWDAAIRVSAGSMSPTINWSNLAKEEFPLPPPAEQRRLVEVLQATKETSESLSFLRSSIALVKDALIKQFALKVSRNGTLELGELVRSIEAGKSPTGQAIPAGRGEYGVLKVSAVGNWEFSPNENKRIEESEYISDFEVRAGDFLVTRANADPNSVARTCIVSESHPGLMLSDKTWRVVFRTDNLFDETGILAWTKSPTFREHILKELSGTDAKNISQERFLASPFPLCSPSVFNDFADRVSSMLYGETILRERIIRLTLIHQGYLRAYMGK